MGSDALDVKLDTKQWIAEVGGFYRFWRAPSRKASLDALVGGRYWNLKSELGLRLSGTEGQTAVKLRENTDWIDPLVGLL